MTDLDAILDAYQASLDCLNIVSGLLVKSRKSVMFHKTIFFGKSPDEAQELLNSSKEDLDDSTIVSLIAAFEHAVFLHRRSVIHSGRAHNKENPSGLAEAIKRFRHQISARVYRDTELLCEYRHWVAHGKRWEKPSTADPVNTHKCLTDFLNEAGLT